MNRRATILSIVRRPVLLGRLGRVLAYVWLMAVAALALQGAEQPRIELIESYPKDNEVVIHFAGVLNRTCTLQYLDRPGTNSIIAGAASGSWSNLYVAEAYPFPTHYVIPDTTTNSRQRFYRLRVTP